MILLSQQLGTACREKYLSVLPEPPHDKNLKENFPQASSFQKNYINISMQKLMLRYTGKLNPVACYNLVSNCQYKNTIREYHKQSCLLKKKTDISSFWRLYKQFIKKKKKSYVNLAFNDHQKHSSSSNCYLLTSYQKFLTAQSNLH